MRVAAGLLEASLDCAFVMVVARDAREKIAKRVQKACLVYASPMEGVDDASILNATRELKEVLCSVRHTVVENDAHIQSAKKVQKEAPPSAKAMVVESDAHSKVVEFAQKACMEGPFTV